MGNPVLLEYLKSGRNLLMLYRVSLHCFYSNVILNNKCEDKYTSFIIEKHRIFIKFQFIEKRNTNNRLDSYPLCKLRKDSLYSNENPRTSLMLRTMSKTFFVDKITFN